MKTLSFLILSIFYIISCSTGIYPLEPSKDNYDVLIAPTGKSEDIFVEFGFTNITDNTLWYWGYSENSPMYLAQVRSDSGWVHYLGWCGTGLRKIPFHPYRSFKINVMKPSTNKAWRVGLQVFRGVEGGVEEYWSDVQH